MDELPRLKEPSSSIYKPLDRDTQQIRLFKILASEDTNATVELRLVRRRLKTVSGRFIPFSYVWGDATDTKTITVNGISTEVTRNLADFLKQTRTLLPDILIKGPWDKSAIFWADAICINQQDSEERNHQVQLLKSIYSSAPLALAWLGNLSDAHLAASLAESLGQSFDGEYSWMTLTLDYSSWMHANPHLWAASEGRNAYWEAFEALAGSPYWARTWTFQEMVLPNQVLLMCGSSLLAWQHVVAVEQLMMALVTMFKYSSFLPATQAHRALYSALFPFHAANNEQILDIIRTRKKLVTPSIPLDLTLVPALVNRQVTDPRDRVYGLLGVIETRLEADYTKDTAQVYVDFASAWIHEIKDINLLLYSQEHRRNARHGLNPLPSWVPDWEAISQEKFNIKDLFDSGIDLVGAFCSDDASKHLPPRNPHLFDDLSTLIAFGVVAGKAEAIYPRWPTDVSDTDFALGVLQIAVGYTSRFGSPLSPRPHILQALFGTVMPAVLESLFQFRFGSQQGSSAALCFLVGVLAWAPGSEGPDWESVAALYLPRLGIPLGQDFSRIWNEEIFPGYSPRTNMPDWENAAAAMEWTWENARAGVNQLITFTRLNLGPHIKFVTNNGYLGISDAAQAGDMVVVLAGCKAPVLLRRRGSHYEHVGPCSVMGLMEGEAKEMVDRGEAKIETFEIR